MAIISGFISSMYSFSAINLFVRQSAFVYMPFRELLDLFGDVVLLFLLGFTDALFAGPILVVLVVL